MSIVLTQPSVGRMPSLRSVTLFAGLSDQTLGTIEQRCRWHNCDAGELVMNHRDSSDDVFFLTEGRARVVIYAADGKAVAFRNIERGDVFGEMAAIDGRPRSAGIEAMSRCTLASLTPDCLWDLLKVEPAVVKALLVHFVTQVRNLTDRIFEFSTLAAANRIQAELLRLSRGHERADGSAEIHPAPRQSEIAERISTQREAVAREFGRLSKLGLIERKGSALVIKNVARLTRMIEEATQQ